MVWAPCCVATGTVAGMTGTPFTPPRGVGAALPTLLDAAGNVDAVLHAALARHLEGRADTLLLGGTTGRGGTLTHSQRVALLDASAGAATLLCGSAPSITDDELAELATSGAWGLLVAFPAGTPLVDAVAHRDRLARHGLGLVAYHHPSHHDPIPPAWYEPLAANGIPVKNSDPGLGVLDAMLTAGLHVLVGSTARLLDANRAAGVLSGLGAVCTSDVAAAYRGDPDAHARLVEFERFAAADRIGTVERLAREALQEPLRAPGVAPGTVLGVNYE
jgi:dihydrodipicolinate synthase/N-acetylneuraminate lyase